MNKIVHMYERYIRKRISIMVALQIAITIQDKNNEQHKETCHINEQHQCLAACTTNYNCKYESEAYKRYARKVIIDNIGAKIS